MRRAPGDKRETHLHERMHTEIGATPDPRVSTLQRIAALPDGRFSYAFTTSLIRARCPGSVHSAADPTRIREIRIDTRGTT